MKMRFAVFSFLAVVAILALSQSACNKEDNPTGPGAGPTIVAPKALRAYSASETSVGLQWDLSTSESDPSFVGYVINTWKLDGSLATSPVTALKNNRDATVSGLTSGVIYTFVIRSTGSAGVVSADSSSVKWSPAKRLTTDITIPEIKLYEFASSIGASGLQFYSLTTATAKTQSLKPANPDRILADVYLSTDGGGVISLKTMALSGVANSKNTFFSDTTHDAENLNFGRLAPPDTNSYTRTTYTVPAAQTSLSKIVYARSITDNKYVRILIKRNPSLNSLISGSSPDRFITVEISYQGTPGNPYAQPPMSIDRSLNR